MTCFGFFSPYRPRFDDDRFRAASWPNDDVHENEEDEAVGPEGDGDD